jgi:hypothetical protein
MVKVIELDEKVTIKTQMEEDVGAVILFNKFTVDPSDVDQFLKTRHGLQRYSIKL